MDGFECGNASHKERIHVFDNVNSCKFQVLEYRLGSIWTSSSPGMVVDLTDVKSMNEVPTWILSYMIFNHLRADLLVEKADGR
ncbi:MAG TPA: hypothetical protein VHU83_15530 [Bryobacteraceae bacterium]|nr:hypothetical protein [Bryobacteraceae bacterium]